MTALLLHGETLRVGVNVIVRAGERIPCLYHAFVRPNCAKCAVYVAPQDWVALTGPCPPFTAADFDNPRLTRPDCRDDRRIVPLYTECHSHKFHAVEHQPPGRRCPRCESTDVWCVDGHSHFECKTCGYGCIVGCENGLRLVGRGSIEVVPVVGWSGLSGCSGAAILVHNGIVWFYRSPHDRPEVLNLDPLPVPGRDWGIVIDCVELVS